MSSLHCCPLCPALNWFTVCWASRCPSAVLGWLNWSRFCAFTPISWLNQNKTKLTGPKRVQTSHRQQMLCIANAISSLPSSTLYKRNCWSHTTHIFDCGCFRTVFTGKGSSVWMSGDCVGRVSAHCGSWMLASCQAKQNLIPSARKARPPLSNPLLSSLVVWSAHTALPPCVSPVGWKNILLGTGGLYPLAGLKSRTDQ